MSTINSVGVGLAGASGTGNFAGTNGPTFVVPVLGTPASGNLVNCTGYPGSIITWAANSSASITAAVNNGYILTHSGATTIALPTTFAVGAIIGVIGTSSSWTLNLGAATNVIAFGNTYTTSFASANNTDLLVLIGTVANTTWQILQMSSTGLTAS